MQLVRFDDTEAFYRQVEDFLLLREAEHNLKLGLCGQLMSGQHHYQPPFYMACVERNRKVVAAAMRTPPFNLILSEMDDEGILPLIADDVANLYSSLPGVLGPESLSRAFAELWALRQGQSYYLNMSQRLYKLDKVIPVQGVSGELRRGTAADRSLAIRWMMAFNEEALDPISVEQAEQLIDNYLTTDSRALYLWCDAGEPVSMVCSTRPTKHGISIGPVYTPPEFRRRGYASACVAAVSSEMLDRGRKFCVLVTDLSNPTSNQIYQAIGYVPVIDGCEYRFAEV